MEVCSLAPKSRRGAVPFLTAIASFVCSASACQYSALSSAILVVVRLKATSYRHSTGESSVIPTKFSREPKDFREPGLVLDASLLEVF